MDEDHVYELTDNLAYAGVNVACNQNSDIKPAPPVIHKTAKKLPPIKNSNKSGIIVLVILVMGLNFLLALSGVVIGISAFYKSAQEINMAKENVTGPPGNIYCCYNVNIPPRTLNL